MSALSCVNDYWRSSFYGFQVLKIQIFSGLAPNPQLIDCRRCFETSSGASRRKCHYGMCRHHTFNISLLAGTKIFCRTLPPNVVILKVSIVDVISRNIPQHKHILNSADKYLKLAAL